MVTENEIKTRIKELEKNIDKYTPKSVNDLTLVAIMNLQYCLGKPTYKRRQEDE